MGGCLDREKERKRILEKLTYQSPQPKLQFSDQIPSLSTNTHHQKAPSLTKQISHFSSKHRSVNSDTLSYVSLSKNKFQLIVKSDLVYHLTPQLSQFTQVNQNILLRFDWEETHEPIKERLISSGTLNKLYLAIKDFIANPEIQIVGIIQESILSFRFYYRIVSRQNIEMQMIERVNQVALEEIVNERKYDNLLSTHLLQFEKSHILIFQTSKKILQTLHVIPLELDQININNMGSELSGKVSVLQNNDEFEFESVLCDNKTKCLYIIMSINQI
ncbi:hypothetical protein pb186bvf_018366 [Paramecium bursaria]